MIINNLKELRLKNNLTQEDLAEKVKVSRQTIISIEKDIYQPSLELAFKLAEILKVDLSEVFTYKK